MVPHISDTIPESQWTIRFISACCWPWWPQYYTKKRITRKWWIELGTVENNSCCWSANNLHYEISRIYDGESARRCTSYDQKNVLKTRLSTPSPMWCVSVLSGYETRASMCAPIYIAVTWIYTNENSYIISTDCFIVTLNQKYVAKLFCIQHRGCYLCNVHSLAKASCLNLSR